jgi:3-hydroxyacyl-CoA dehydrogenase
VDPAWCRSDVLIASIKTKMHAISPDVVEGFMQGLDMAEKELQRLGDLVA